MASLGCEFDFELPDAKTQSTISLEDAMTKKTKKYFLLDHPSPRRYYKHRSATENILKKTVAWMDLRGYKSRRVWSKRAEAQNGCPKQLHISRRARLPTMVK